MPNPLNEGASGHGMRARVTRTNHQFVRQSLRRAILAGEYAPGERLIQADIAKELDVSTTPVREALRDLAGEGLLRLDAYRGAVIKPLDLDEITEIHMLLQALEPLTIERAVQFITADELNEADQVLAEMVRGGDSAEFVSLDREFHGIFAGAARSPRLESMVNSLRDNAALYIAASFRDSAEMVAHANEDHRKLLQALRDRDRESAVTVACAHLEWAHRRWLTSMEHTESAEETAEVSAGV
jgi:DNA-binding GntR family transcriptional regulator